MGGCGGAEARGCVAGASDAVPRTGAPIVVIDYHKGNLSSVRRGLIRAGWENVAISDDPVAIRAAAGLVLPGVGAFYDAITFMRASGQDAAILGAVAAGTPILGICLGLQLLLERGDEGVPADAPGAPWVAGLGLLGGSCTRLDAGRLKVPHVGWDQIHVTEEGRACPLLSGVPEGANVYYTHSYAAADDVSPAQVAARTHYTRSFAGVMWEGNVFGCQFHPEKSSGTGLAILRNYVSIVRGRTSGAREKGSASA